MGLRGAIFSLLLDFNFAHFGVSLASSVNTAQNNFAVGTNLRSSSEEWQSVARPRGLWVELTINRHGTIERNPRSLAERLFTTPDNALTVLALLKRIEQDPRVGHVVLNINGFSFGDARTEEWRNAISSLRSAKKEVIIYLDAPSERDYYIASAANKIRMNKFASLSLSNFQATLVYYADMLKKFGVKAEAVVAGKYKTAPRQWTEDRPRPEELEVASNILDNFYERLVNDVSLARNIPQHTLKALLDKGELTAVEAKDAGLVDELVSPIIEDDNEQMAQGDRRRFIRDYEDIVQKREQWHPPKKIAVIPVVDTISSGRAVPGLFSWVFPSSGAKDIIDEIENAVNDENVIGIIVRIDSPGGDAAAGSRINQALMLAQRAKPVVTSMSDVAASAGYLIAAGTEHILALPNTITGSIGVFSLAFSGEHLAQKLGVFAKELSPIKNPGPTIFRTMTASERKEAEHITDWFYNNFIESVSVGLDLDKEAVQKVANGRVWLGQEAFERKLVHELGGFMEAVDALRAIANIAEDENLAIEIRSPGLAQQFSLTNAISAMFKSKSSEDKEALAYLASPYLKALEAYRINGVPQARMAFDIEWKR